MSSRKPIDPPNPSRREFVGRTVAVGLGLATATGLAAWLHDSTPPAIVEPGRAPVSLPSYSLPDRPPAMAIIKGQDRPAMVAAGFKALGGMEAWVKPGDRVLLKVNAAFASPPELGATTHPDLLQAVVKLCRAAGAKEVVVTDNPINDPASCFRLSGLAEAAAVAGARLVLPRPQAFRPVTLKDARLIKDWPLLHEPLEGINKVIGLAPLKDHHRSGASMTMKNWYGLLGGRRNVFHQDINTIIAELARLVRPTLVILDGTQAMVSNGPTGGSLEDLKPTHTMIISTDQVAADAAGAGLLGLGVGDLPWLGLASKAGVGATDYQSLKPIRVGA